MPLTLAEARELSNSELTKTVIDDFKVSPLLDKMIFDNTAKAQGGKSFGYQYNRITTYATAAQRALNTEYTPQEAKTTRISTELAIFGGAFELDRAISNEEEVLNLFDFEMQQKVKATIAKFNEFLIVGDSAVEGGGFDGLDKAVTGTSTEYIPSAAIDISTAAAVDSNATAFMFALRQARKTLNGTPDFMIVNSDAYACIQSVADKVTSFNTTKATAPDGIGSEIMYWGGTRILEMGDKSGTADPIIPTDDATGETSAYFVRLGLDGVHGITPEGTDIVKTFYPDMTAPNAVKKGEVEIIAGMAVKSTKAAGVIRNIKVV